MKDLKIDLKAIIFFSLVLRLLLISSPSHVDVFNHLDWGERFWQYGPKDFYEQIFWGFSWPNQPIGSILLFAGITKIYHFIFQILWCLNLKISIFPSFIFPFVEQNLHLILLKLPFAIIDLGLGILIYKIVKTLSQKGRMALLASALFLFNPALIYNSTVWGQTDSLVNFLGLLGLWGIWKKRYFWGFLAFFGSLYFKLSLIIFAPLMGLMIWFRSPRRSAFAHLRGVFMSFGGAVSIFLLISLPFVHHGNVVSWLWYLYTNRVLPRQGEMLTGNAFNFWTLLYGQDLTLNENVTLLGSTAKFWGRLVFLFLGGIATLLFLTRRKKKDFYSYLSLGVVYAFCAFLFLTNMHERHLYPVFPLLAILAAREKKILTIYLILALVHFLNLYNLWWQPQVGILISLFSGFNNLLPRILSLVNLGIFVVLLKFFLTNERKFI